MAKATRPKKKSPPRPSPKRTPPPKPRPKKAAKKASPSRTPRRPQPTARPRGQKPVQPPGRSGPKPPPPPTLSQKFHQRTLVVAAKTPQALQKAIDAAEERTRHGVKVECVFPPAKGVTPWFTLTFMESKR